MSSNITNSFFISSLTTCISILERRLNEDKKDYKNGIMNIEVYVASKEYCNKWIDRYNQCITLLQMP